MAKPTPTQRDRVDLINFIIDATANVDLARRFLKCSTAEQIRDFFKKEGYDDIPLNDCEDILEASKRMRGHGVSKTGEPVPTTVGRVY